MTTTNAFLASIFLASLALTAPAQAQPAAGASAPAAMAHDCAKPMAMHDHAAEKGNPKPTSKSDGCSPAKASSTTSAASAAGKNKMKHDHAKDAK